LLEVSEFDQRVATGFRRGHATAQVVRDVQVDMGGQFGVAIAFEASFAEEIANAK